MLTPTRLCELYFKPITPEDFYLKIISSGGERVSDTEFEPYTVFLQKTPYGQKDLKRQEVIQAELERKRKAAATAAKKAAMAAKVSFKLSPAQKNELKFYFFKGANGLNWK